VLLRGRVFSGKGEGAEYIGLDWVKKQTKEKLGFTPYEGTLNMLLTVESVEDRKLLMKSDRLEIAPNAGYCSAKLFKASVGNVACAIVIPEVRGYPEDVIEVIAPSNLRRMLNLVEGSMIEVKVTF
jgi:riboflavin kinase